MDLFLIDAIGPFFRGYDRKVINWSKIPFLHLDGCSDDWWRETEAEMRRFAGAVRALGYNAVSLDDLAHLASHPLHEPGVASRINGLRGRFSRIFDLLGGEFGLRVYLTSDVLPLTPALAAAFGEEAQALDSYYQDLVCSVLDDFPRLAGLILRIGESDGKDVKDPIRTRLHVKDAASANRMLRALLPEFERRGRELIFRTWTVGAHAIGDLIWNQRTLDATLAGLDSPSLIVSMKPGESDFFRYLPLNPAFFRVRQKKLLELQARREYEGAGEFPSFIGMDCERFAGALARVEGMAGISVWCQTGGWHRFRRRAWLEAGDRDIWIRLNATAAIQVFKHGRSARAAVEGLVGPERASSAWSLLGHAETVIARIYYIGDFAGQKLFFRRVRVPPLLHVYWDSLLIHHGIRRLMRHSLKDPERALASGEEAIHRFAEMERLAREAGLPVDDIEHMRDVFGLILLARQYYLLPADENLAERIRAAKAAYKVRWPKRIRQRFRIRLGFTPIPVGRRTFALAAMILLRRGREYRWLDRLVVMPLAGVAYRMLQARKPKALPKLLRKSAMGIGTLFK